MSKYDIRTDKPEAVTEIIINKNEGLKITRMKGTSKTNPDKILLQASDKIDGYSVPKIPINENDIDYVIAALKKAKEIFLNKDKK